MSWRNKLLIATIVVLTIVVLMKYYDIEPTDILEGKIPFISDDDQKNKLHMEQLIKSIHERQGIKM